MARSSPRAAAQRLPVATLGRPLSFAAAGFGLGAVALAVDRATGLVIAPASAGGAQALLASVVGAAITVTALLFWVRGMLVQLAAGELSPRLLRWYLEDQFLLRSIAFIIGVFTYCATVLLALPGDPEAPAPAISTTLALGLSIAALCSVVVAIINSVHVTDNSEMLNQIAGETLAHIQEQLPDARERVDDPEPPQAEVTRPQEIPLRARDSGWVTHVDHEGLMEGLPPGASLRLRVAAGTFVIAGARLATLGADDGLEGEDGERLADDLRALVTIERRRAPGQDVAFGVRKLVDVAVQAVAPGANDATRAHEATSYVGVALRELLFRRLPPRLRQGPEGRFLVLDGEPGYADYVYGSFGALRQAAAPAAPTMVSLLRTMGELREELRDFEDGDAAQALERESQRVLEKACESDMVSSDRAQVEAVARELGVGGDGRPQGPRATLPI